MIGVLTITQNERANTKGVSINGIGFSKREVIDPLELKIFVNNQVYCSIQGVYNNNTYDLNCKFNDTTIVESYYYNQGGTIQGVKDLAGAIGDAMNGEGTNALLKFIVPTIKCEDGSTGSINLDYDIDENNKKYPIAAGNILGLDFKFYEIGSDKNVNPDSSNYSYIHDSYGKVVAALCEKGCDVIIYANDDIWFRVASLYALHVLFNKYKKEELTTGPKFILNKRIKTFADKEFITNIINNTSPDNLPENMTIIKEAKKQLRKQSFNVLGIVFAFIFIVMFIIVFMMTK